MERAVAKLVAVLSVLMALGTCAVGFSQDVTWPISAEGVAGSAQEAFEPAQTMAQVGDQYILKGELVGDANLLLSGEFARLETVPPAEQEQFRKAIYAQRDQLMEQLLQHAIDRKLMYIEYLRSIPVIDEKKSQEKWVEVRKRSNTTFREQLNEMAAKVRVAPIEEYQTFMRQNYQLFRVSMAMKVADIQSADDPRLELFLRQHGTSMDTQQRAYMERMLGQLEIRKNINLEPDITHDQMLNYYREKADEFQVSTRAKWEQLTVLFSRFPNKQTAGEQIAMMGNQVYFGGAPFWSVAKKFSQEKKAEQGGFHDWTVFGDLTVSREINDAVFSLNLNELSGIIEDNEGLHIIRVLERQNAHMVPFVEAQADIKTRLKNEAINKSYADYISKLRQKTPIWTIYDELHAPGQSGRSSITRAPSRP